jgi:hypothetical protein
MPEPEVTVLEAAEILRFARDGYLVVPDVVPELLLAAADTEIDSLVVAAPPAEGDRGPGVNAWFPPRARLPRCDDVLRLSPALGLAEQLVAPLHLDHAFDHIQVSTTLPPWSHRPGGPHIDGHGPGQDPPMSFTMLAGVMLTDQRRSQSGNLWVWPGSHLVHQQLFRGRGTRVLQATGGHSTLIDPPAPVGEPVEVCGARGDVLLAHFLLGHNKGGNTGAITRRTIYYRLATTEHRERWDATFLDAWTEYAPVRRVLAD